MKEIVFPAKNIPSEVFGVTAVVLRVAQGAFELVLNHQSDGSSKHLSGLLDANDQQIVLDLIERLVLAQEPAAVMREALIPEEVGGLEEAP